MTNVNDKSFRTPRTIDACLPASAGRGVFFEMEATMDPNLLAIVIPLLCQVESNNQPNAIGDYGGAIGILQIRLIMIADVNRIQKETRYYLSDRWDVQKSYEIATIYFEHYGPKAIRGLKTEEKKVVTLARMWNGGPCGHRKLATWRYGRKVRKLYRERKVKK